MAATLSKSNAEGLFSSPMFVTMATISNVNCHVVITGVLIGCRHDNSDFVIVLDQSDLLCGLKQLKSCQTSIRTAFRRRRRSLVEE